MRAINHSARITTATLLALLLGAYVYSTEASADDGEDNVSRVNGRIEIETEQRVGNVSTVNGSISIGRGAVARSVSTVNGGIDLRDGASARDLDTVNGDIEIDSGAQIDGTISTVNGGIEMDREVLVQGSVSTVNGAIRADEGTDIRDDVRTANGRIRLYNTRVGGGLVTRHGDITLQDGTVVEGDIEFRDHDNWFQRLFGFGFHDDPRLVIDASSSVHGDIHLYHRVDLDIADGADIGEIIRHY